MAYGFNDDKSKEKFPVSKELVLKRTGDSSATEGLMFPVDGIAGRRVFAVVSLDELKNFLIKNNVSSFSTNSNNGGANVILSIFMNSTRNNSSREPLTCVRCRVPFKWDATNMTIATSSSAPLEFEVIEMVAGRVTHDHYTGRIATILKIYANSLEFAADNAENNVISNRWSVNEFTNAFTSGATVNPCYCQIAKIEIMNN